MIRPGGGVRPLPSVWIELYWHSICERKRYTRAVFKIWRLQKKHRVVFFSAVRKRGSPERRVWGCSRVWAALKRRHGPHEGTAAGGGAGGGNDGWHVQPVKPKQANRWANLSHLLFMLHLSAVNCLMALFYSSSETYARIYSGSCHLVSFHNSVTTWFLCGLVLASLYRIIWNYCSYMWQ